ncbi:MAG: trehalose-phosphatase, partial [Candidatus Omnitrophica bacterium]|nr:trehalose-phosphatase [Candidatus Omnitrophota bacterium]
MDDKKVFFFLDYDGTLAPIVDTPEKALLSQETRELLRRVAVCFENKLAIISGRALEDVKKRVGLSGIVYAGNHGLEIEGPQITYAPFGLTRYRKTLEKIKDALAQQLSFIEGVLIEDKGLTISLHYRKVNAQEVSLVKTLFGEITLSAVVKEQIRVKPGKMVLEIRPPVQWDKGKVVL